MAESLTTGSIQEMAAEFANGFLASLNSMVAETVGVDVIWFRATPDKRSQDVIFQTYTLYGVEDCPLTLKAVYTDNSYDDAAITFNIMGLEYSVPLTLEIAVNTWYEATNYDGTLPQRGDIVFIPISRKLMEVVSMTPVKKIGAQLTSFKVNLSIYKPTRSRIVGENLKESIKENTVNLNSRFGKDIDETFKNIVDEDQLSIFSTTSVDRAKENAVTRHYDSIMKDVNNIIENNINIDGHIVSRSYYDAHNGKNFVVRYKRADSIQKSDMRCLSCLVQLHSLDETGMTNIAKMSLKGNILTVEARKKLDEGTEVIISRGTMSIVGKVISKQPYCIELNKDAVSKLNSASNSWFSIPGYTIEKVSNANILTGIGDTGLSIDIKSGKIISLMIGDKETQYRLTTPLVYDKWYGVIINLGENTSIDVFEELEQLTNIVHLPDMRNKYWQDLEIKNYQLNVSNCYITNIRLYDTKNTEIDKQLMDLTTYNIPNSSHAIINDSTDIYLDKKFTGIKG
jgi:hypothetical protein